MKNKAAEIILLSLILSSCNSPDNIISNTTVNETAKKADNVQADIKPSAANSVPSPANAIPVEDSNSITIKLTNLPEKNVHIIARLTDFSGKEYQGEFINQDFITFTGVPSAVATIKAFIFGENSLPIGKVVNKSFIVARDKTLFEVPLELVIKNNKFSTEISPGIQAEIKKNLNSIFTDHFFLNPAPAPIIFKSEDIQVFIDEKLVSAGAQIALQPTSLIKVNVKTSEQRKLKYLWAVSTVSSLDKKLETSLRSERENTFQIKLSPELKYISFIATDFKSASNVVIVPIE